MNPNEDLQNLFSHFGQCPKFENTDANLNDDNHRQKTRRTFRKYVASFLQNHSKIVLILLIVFIFFYYFWSGGNVKRFHPSILPTNISQRYLVLNKNCHIKNWTLFDSQTSKLFEEITSDQTYDCTSSEQFAAKLMLIERQNRTWIRWSTKPNADTFWFCYGREIKFDGSNDWLRYGEYRGPLPNLYNFDSDLMTERLKNSTKNSKNVERQKWDAVEIKCNSTGGWWKKSLTYIRVIPLVQSYQIREQQQNQTKTNAPNVLLLGIDSVSRLNFLRHFHQTEKFLNENHFIPLYGHHKVGTNTFPNLMPIFTGYPHTDYWSESIGSKLKFDNIPLIFFEYKRRGYITTFIEDMPPYGIFTYTGGGFRYQPTDYYLRPVNIAIWPHLYNDYVCYQGEIEYEIYNQYMLELLELFQSKSPSRPHLTLLQWSTLTHNKLNNAGFADQIFARFIRRLFEAKLQENTVIVFFSDHGVRNDPIQNTKSGNYEQRLPFLYLYISDSVNISGLNGKQLRNLVRTNQRRLTSHFDLHATMRHIVEGKPPPSKDEPYGLSLFTQIPENRTCYDAGIPSHFCVCGSMVPAPLDKKIDKLSQFVVDKLNNLLKPYESLCANLTLNSTQFALVAVEDEFNDEDFTDVDSERKPEQLFMIQFKVNPSERIFESTIVVEQRSGNITVMGDISRINNYGNQSKCFKNNVVIEQYCYCKDEIKPITKTTTTEITTKI